MHIAPHLLLEGRDVVHVVGVPERQRHLAGVAVHIGVIPPQLLPRRRLVVVGEIAQEEEGQHVIAEVVRVHRPAQLVGDAPKRVAQLFLVGVGHGAEGERVSRKDAKTQRGEESKKTSPHILVVGQALRADASAEQGLAHGGVVGDMFARNLRFGAHLVGAGVVDGDLGGEVLSLENDGRGEIGKRSGIRHSPVGSHRLGALAEECLISLAANEGEVLVAAGLLEDELGQFFFRGGELLPGGDALSFEEALLDQLRTAG